MQSQKDSLQVSPIGFLRSVFDHKFGTPRQGLLAPSSEAKLELVPALRNKGMFTGLEGFSHVWLISHFHQNKNIRAPGKIHPPRLLGKAVGVFASRSPHHPNSLGLSLAKLVNVDGDKIKLSGIDLVEGTPILDLKPYLAEGDRPENFSCGWAEDLPIAPIACTLGREAELQLNTLVAQQKIANAERFKALVIEVLRLDPRPLSYRARVNERFAVVLGGMDVHARYNAGEFIVESIRPFVATD